MTHEDVQAWLNRYVEAWRSYDEAAIGELFSSDAEYRWHPYDRGSQLASGRSAIVKAWLENRDDPGTWEAHYEPYAVDGRRAVAVGSSRYHTAPEKLYHNVFLVEFDGDGRCRRFTEWYMLEPEGR